MEKAGDIIKRTLKEKGIAPPRKPKLAPKSDAQLLLDADAMLAQKRAALKALDPAPVTAITRHQTQLIEAASQIMEQWPGRDELAYMAKHLVQVTLPHSDPGDISAWTRTNGDLTLVITRSNIDLRSGKMIGYPYGTIPRLLLYWLTSEAVRTKQRVLKLGSSLAQFMREVGLNPDTGGGKRGDAFRLKEQMNRLFGATISFQYADMSRGHFEQRLNMNVTRKTQLWWNPKDPNQGNLFESWIELGEDFFESITSSPVPVDTRALKALNHSALALDLYGWATHKTYSVSRRRESQFISFKALQAQFGAQYAHGKDFKKKFLIAMKQVEAVYPSLKVSKARGGLIVHPSRPSVPISTLKDLA
jgi:hypothetical protein